MALPLMEPVAPLALVALMELPMGHQEPVAPAVMMEPAALPGQAGYQEPAAHRQQAEQAALREPHQMVQVEPAGLTAQAGQAE